MDTMVPPALAPPARATFDRVVAVIVTRDRPHLLHQCLVAVLGQTRAPDEVIVVDNASGAETAAVVRMFAGTRCLRLDENLGGAGGFKAGLEAGLARDATWLWVMDDDGRPESGICLASLLASAQRHAAALVGALVIDVDAPQRLSFPLRLAGRTVFEVAGVARHGPVHGFAHLFNGTLLGADLVRRIGLPDSRFFIRGDEVEYLYRARQAGERIVLDVGARFLHPGSAAEIHPIFGGLFYAVVPTDDFKRYHQFRNRGYIFRQYGMWPWMAADIVRYGAYYLINRRGDLRGLHRWALATWCGIQGRFMKG